MPFGLALAGVGRSLLGGLFGKRSVYKFVPGHPPGSFRGAAALADYNKRMRELGLKTVGGGGTRSAGQTALAMITPAVLQKLSPVMPGGATVAGAAGGPTPFRKPRKKSKRRAAAARRRSPKRRSRRRKLSARQIAAGFGGRRRQRRR